MSESGAAQAAKCARAASFALAASDAQTRNRALTAIAEALQKNRDALFKANALLRAWAEAQ